MTLTNVHEGENVISFGTGLIEPPEKGAFLRSKLANVKAHSANLAPVRPVASHGAPPPLAPSQEEAYRKKCIELKRRLKEVEEQNDVFRVRKARLARGIRKMRLERAYLLEMLGKRMQKNGSSVDGFPLPYDEESEGSSEGPPTV